MRLFYLLSLAAANDESSLLQSQKLAKHAIQATAKAGGVEQLLTTAKALAAREDEYHRDPIRQCDGGWLAGDGIGGSEVSIQGVSQEACVAAVREQCPDANAASFDADSQTCFCEVGQSDVDSSASGRVNCLFFTDGTTDEDMDTAVDSLAELVESMVAAMNQEQEAAQQVVSMSGQSLSEAHGHISHHLASTVETLETARDQAAEALATCQDNLDHWTGKEAEDCPAWESHVHSLAVCQEACPCQSGTDTFYNAATVWQNILGNGGWEEITSLKEACDLATTRKNEYTAACPPLADAAGLAEAAYQAARTTHLEFCETYAEQLSSHQSIAERITASLEQRQREYDILQQVSCYIERIRESTENSQLVSSACPPGNFDGLGESLFSITWPAIPDAPVCLPAAVLVMKAVTNAFTYTNPIWENTDTLNSASPADEVVDAKYGTFMTSHFNTIMLCAGGPTTGCITHPLQNTYESAHVLFTSGYISDTTIDQGRWLTNFAADTGIYNVECPMQRPGFNTVCRDGNSARFGWCNNVGGQSCHSDSQDSDGSIGIGLTGQNGGNTGAGHSCWFASDHSGGDTSCTGLTVPTWVYVDMVRPTTQPPVLIMKAVSNLLDYNHPLWENLETLNPASPVEQVVDAKYAAFMSARFNSIRLCAGGPNTHCMSHRLAQTYDSAHALFTAGFVSDTTIDQGTWLTNFAADTGIYNVECPMQHPGFNTVCRDGNSARFGWCNNVGGQSCQGNGADSDGSIGIGLTGQNGGNTGAGHSCWFASDHSGGNLACTGATIPTWVYVEEV